MSGIIEGAVVSVALEVVKGLMKEVMKEVVNPLWNRNKNAIALHSTLTRLEPIISSMDTARATSPQQEWLKELCRRLESVKKVLIDNMEPGCLAKYPLSKKVLEETWLLSELYQEASVVGLQSCLKIVDDVNRMTEQLEGQRRDLAHITRAVLNRSNGLSTEMASKDVFIQIKEQADCIMTSALLSTSSCTTLEINQALVEAPGVATLRRQDTLTAFGGEQVIKDAHKLLLESDSHWCGLWARGGAGKTHAAQRIFNKNEIQAHFKGGCYWLTVGQSKTITSLLIELCKSMLGKSNQPLPSESIDLKILLSSELQNRESILLVVDDVWKWETLPMLDVMPRKRGCKVFVTTRNREVLDKQHAPKLELPLLSFGDSWELFCHHACRGVPHMPHEVVDIAKDITRECKGLPLALKVIGGGFAGNTNLRYWMLSYERLKNADNCDLNVQLFLQLKPSVDELDRIPCPHLKDCFFYFAAFPEDYEVELERDLFPLWLGDRIIGRNVKYDPMLEAWELLGWLISRSLIEMHTRGGSTIFKVHDVLRDLARHLLQNDLPEAKRECLYEAGQDLGRFPEEWVPNSAACDVILSARRLSVMSSKVKKLPQKLLDAPKLQVMILRGNPIEAIPDGFFRCNLRNLRVLNLSETWITSLPSDLGNLKHLVVLNLEGTPVKKLPSSLGNLANLELLNLDDCDELAYLPSSFSSLSKLQHLFVMNFFGHKDVWAKAGVASRVLTGRGCLKDLKHLVALKQLRIESESPKALPTGIFKALKELRELRLRFPKLVTIPELASDELQHLQILDISGCESLTSLPCSFRSLLMNLHTLKLYNCKGLMSLPALDGLPNLAFLGIRRCYGLRSLPDSFSRPGAFPGLKELYMGHCSAIASFPKLQPGAMPRLEVLSLHGWDQLVDFPKGVGNLTKLRVLYVSGCSNLQSLEHDGVGVENLINLEEFHVMGSGKISELPASLAQLPKLKKIYMGGCPATVPQAVEDLVTRGRIELNRED